MKLRFLFSLMLGATLAASAQGGYQDGVDNYNAGRLDVAKVILNNTINDASTDKAVAYYYLGDIAYSDGDLTAAKANFDKGIQANPENALNYIGLGQLALKAGNKSEAQKYFDDVLKANKKNTALMAAVARAYWSVDPVAYAKDIDKLIAKALKESKNTESAVYMLQGDMAAAEDAGKAAGKYEMAIEQDKAKGIVNREGYVKYANVYIRHNPELVIEKLEELNKLEPNSGLAQRELAEKYYDNQQMGRAWKQYEKYVQNPNHFRRDEQRYAGLLYSAGEYDQSIQWADKILKEDPSIYQMNRILMLNYAALDNDSLAVVYGEKLFTYPNATLVANDYVVYGDNLAKAKKFDEAIAIYEKAIELNPENYDLLPKLSQVYQSADKDELAVETMKKFLDTGKATTNDYFNMARRYLGLARSLEKGTPERAAACDEGLKYVDIALERAPSNYQVHYTRASLLLTKNDDKPDAETAAAYEKELECLDNAGGLTDRNKNFYSGAYYMLGSYYAPIDKAKAKEYYGKYLEIDPTNETIQKIYNEL